MEVGEVLGDNIHVVVLILDLLHIVRNFIQFSFIFAKVRANGISLRVRL